MDLNLTDDQRMIVRMVADFADKELAPTAAARDETGEFPLPVYCKMAELGLSGMNVPAEWGGSEAGPVAYVLALMEIARADASVSVTTSVTNMLAEAIHLFGTEDQKKKFIPMVCAGDYPIGAFALTESGSGTDAASHTRPAGNPLPAARLRPI